MCQNHIISTLKYSQTQRNLTGPEERGESIKLYQEKIYSAGAARGSW